MDSPSFCERSGVTEFTDLVVIGLQVISDDVATLDDAEKTAIAEEFVSTYNACFDFQILRYLSFTG